MENTLVYSILYEKKPLGFINYFLIYNTKIYLLSSFYSSLQLNKFEIVN